MAGIGFVAAPVLFSTLDRASAGRAATQLFGLEAVTGLACGGLLLVATMQQARLDAEAQRGSRFSADMALALAALFCVVAGHYGLQPMIESARQGTGSGPTFVTLHLASTGFYGLRFIALALLAWRLSAPTGGMALRPAAPTS